MLFSESVMSKYVYYLKIKEIEFFNSALEHAKSLTRELSEIPDKDEIKKRTPVFYGSECKSFDGTRQSLSLNDDCKRRYIVFDGDFNKIETSEKSRERLINFAEEHNYALIIYPTVSAPEKPRWRSIMFVKNLLTIKNQIAAAEFLIQDVMKIPAEEVDNHNYDVFHNFNFPVFTDPSQFELIYNNTDKMQGFVDPSFFKERAKEIKVYVKDKNTDKLPESLGLTRGLYKDMIDGELNKAMKKTEFRNILADHKNFYKYIMSLSADTITGDLTMQEAFEIADVLASVAPDNVTREKWSRGNKDTLMRNKKDPNFKFNSHLYDFLKKYTTQFE